MIIDLARDCGNGCNVNNRSLQTQQGCLNLFYPINCNRTANLYFQLLPQTYENSVQTATTPKILAEPGF